MADDITQTIPARKGKAARTEMGQQIKVINTHGYQVVDSWAFDATDMTEYMSMNHSHVAIDKLGPVPGDAMVTNHRRPILTLLEDTTPGVHDTLVAACDRWRYEQLGCAGYHDNCEDNLWNALAELGFTPPTTPAPFNLFMNTPYMHGRGFG